MTRTRYPKIHSVVFRPNEFELVNNGFHNSSGQTLKELSITRPDFAIYRLAKTLMSGGGLSPLIIVQNSAEGFIRSDQDGEAARVALLNTLEGNLSRTRYIEPYQVVVSSFTNFKESNFYHRFDIAPSSVS